MRHTHTEFFKLLGFQGARDMVASAFGLKAYPLPLLKIQLSGTLLAAVVAFCAKWIWSPPSAMFLLLALDLLNARYGYLADVKLRGGRFHWDELQRTAGKMLATLLVLMAVKNAINSYEYYSYAADVVFAWLFTHKLRKLVVKMVALKVVEGGLPKLILGLLASKFGPYIVDAVQKKEPAPEPASELVAAGGTPPAGPTTP
ncbi:hypothetical protein [Hymenobacter metallicola]|uniref:Uncharacterized protein n=1 Tax=Hymenobacter metallicola TaxID=2563114 RepID=A0A4Z0QLY2_9BACT|nr:hypothetical protein [Hymenobacter metallicola]TGE29742.1 hypothetical protein E5K02_09865 [Hymenobacter metallicola]